MSGWTGVDLSAHGLDEPIRYVDNDAGRSVMENITRADPARRWTVRDVAEHVAVGGIGPVLVGTPSAVADGMEAWMDATGVDGFNLASIVAHETFADVSRFLVPELQRRGRYKRRYAPGTLRHKLFGAGLRLREPHPAAAFRFDAAPASAVPAHPSPPAYNQGPARMDPDPPTAAACPVPATDGEAIAAAHRLAAAYRPGAMARDRGRVLPHAEVEQYSATGLGGITVPREHGGPDLSAATLAEVTTIIPAANPSAANPSLGQISQNQHGFMRIGSSRHGAGRAGSARTGAGWRRFRPP